MSPEARIAIAAIRLALMVKQTRKNRKLRQTNENLNDQIAELLHERSHYVEALQSANARQDYLIALIQEHEIAPTEFDLIALNNLM